MYSLSNLEGVLSVKSILMSDTDFLVDGINSEKEFVGAIISIANLFANELAFILIGEDMGFMFFDEILNLVNKFRFKTTDSDINLLCNQTIGMINQVKSIGDEDRENIIFKYIYEQEKLRDMKVSYDYSNLLISNSCDIALYFGFINDVLTNVCDYNALVGSINYYINSYPEMFFDNSFNSDIKEILDYLNNESLPFSKMHRKVKAIKNKLSI